MACSLQSFLITRQISQGLRRSSSDVTGFGVARGLGMLLGN